MKRPQWLDHKKWLEHQWLTWLDRRLPRAKHIRLNQRNIFIFPSEEGFVFVGLCLLVFVGGVNYENSLMLGSALMLGSLFIISIMATYLNFAGLVLSAHKAHSAYVDDQACVELGLFSARSWRYGLWVRLEDFVMLVDVHPGVEQLVDVPFRASKRGKAYPPRILLETRYPLGLVRAWTWLSLDQYAIIYPKPQACQIELRSDGTLRQPSGPQTIAGEESEGMRLLRPGDPIRSILWKYLAKTGQLYVRSEESDRAAATTLTLASVPGPDLETRLAQLTWWIERLSHEHIPFSLDLPGVRLPFGHGDFHRVNAMHIVALYGVEK